MEQEWTRCVWCQLLIKKPKPEPLNPYLVELGFKLSGKLYHGNCFKQMIQHEQLQEDET